MLIDVSYFIKGARQIHNAAVGTLLAPEAKPVVKAIEAYIAENQERYLVRMLGNKVGNRVHTYLTCLDEEENTKHNEHIDAVCSQLRESFADYVFYQILRGTNTQATINGVVRIKNANTSVSPIRRQVSAWNSMVERNRLFSSWCESSECQLSGIVISKAMITPINSLNL